MGPKGGLVEALKILSACRIISIPFEQANKKMDSTQLLGVKTIALKIDGYHGDAERTNEKGNGIKLHIYRQLYFIVSYSYILTQCRYIYP